MSCVLEPGGSQNFSLAGSLLTLLAGISFGAYSIVGRHQFRNGVSFPVIAGSVTLGTLLLAPLALGEILLTGPGHITPGSGLMVVYLGVAGSAVVHCLWSVGLRHLESIEVAALGTVMPFAGIAFAMIFLNETLTLNQALCGMIIVVGLTLSIQKEQAESPDRSPVLSSRALPVPNP